MPIIDTSTYQPPRFFSNGHIQTIFPTLFRRVQPITYERERLETHDGDFLDLDWLRPVKSQRLAIIAHGLEGSSDRKYVRGMVRYLNLHGWHTLSWNFRGCSGEPNRLHKYYHSGKSEDLRTIVNHVRHTQAYDELALIGFSIGGNITLKYLGEEANQVAHEIKAAVALSVPVDLKEGSDELKKRHNKIYMKRFLIQLKEKIEEKLKIFPGHTSLERYHELKNFEDFDNRYTAPLNGFKDAHDYWQKASSKPFLSRIQLPTLILSAQNDPFLPKACYPIEEARQNPLLYLEMPASGGHVGFIEFNRQGHYWSEKRTLEFLLAAK